ncbi:hypothetical protein D3C84_768140 [compost metagenome]
MIGAGVLLLQRGEHLLYRYSSRSLYLEHPRQHGLADLAVAEIGDSLAHCLLETLLIWHATRRQHLDRSRGRRGGNHLRRAGEEFVLLRHIQTGGLAHIEGNSPHHDRPQLTGPTCAIQSLMHRMLEQAVDILAAGGRRADMGEDPRRTQAAMRRHEQKPWLTDGKDLVHSQRAGVHAPLPC